MSSDAIDDLDDDKPRARKPRPSNLRVEPMTDLPAEIVAPAKTFTREMLAPDQGKVYDAVVAWLGDVNRRQYLTFGGFAGTGKTTLLSVLGSELQKNYDVVYGAYTGKATNVLGRKLREAGIAGQCGTLHSLMYQPQMDPKTGKVMGWAKREEIPGSLIVVDEASMVGEDVWDDLVSYGKPILAVGDHGQLPPVGKSVKNLMAKPDLKLEKIHRQAEGNPIIAFAHHVRRGGHPKAFKSSDTRVRYVSKFIDVAHLVAADPAATAAICYTNKTRCALNAAVRSVKGYQGPHPDPGDTVVCLKNEKPIFNGMRGVLEETRGEHDACGRVEATIAFPDDRFRVHGRINVHQFGKPKTFDDYSKLPGNPTNWYQVGLLFDYGYGLTCHKAQGSQFRTVVLVNDFFSRDNDGMRERWWYTAITRAVDELIVVG